jgi:photoactive yellow protein
LPHAFVAARGVSELTQLVFNGSEMCARLGALDDAELDGLDFGVIGFDAQTVVRRYNAFEANYAGVGASRVVGRPLFTMVAPCMNNYLVAQRFEDAAAGRVDLDATIDYVLTLRMRPLKVYLRLLASPEYDMRYLLVSGRQE